MNKTTQVEDLLFDLLERTLEALDPMTNLLRPRSDLTEEESLKSVLDLLQNNCDEVYVLITSKYGVTARVPLAKDYPDSKYECLTEQLKPINIEDYWSALLITDGEKAVEDSKFFFTEQGVYLRRFVDCIFEARDIKEALRRHNDKKKPDFQSYVDIILRDFGAICFLAYYGDKMSFVEFKEDAVMYTGERS